MRYYRKNGRTVLIEICRIKEEEQENVEHIANNVSMELKHYEGDIISV